ncbi:hypothetical protein ABIA35_001284 [Catenulispora sp. MAP12-49]|uniref:TauD/TfdA family dioxygenase n=1 Tax=Catenulispora sp. MAP12-49 TaxID=3156302 RepID=UPI003515401F
MTPPGGPPVAGRRRPLAMTVDPDAAVVEGAPSGASLPLLVRRAEGSDVTLAAWAAAHGDRVGQWLPAHGAVLFRGFDVDLDGFGAVARSLAGEPEEYVERSSPRTALGDRVYTATDHPADQPIVLHNENSYQAAFPARLAFCCLQAPVEGGATPVADVRQVLARIPDDIVRRFEELGVAYVRTFGGGLGLPWQEVFQTDSRAVVAEYCEARGIEVDWRSDGRLATRQVRPAVARHPVTGRRAWFNHAAFFNVHSLPEPVRVPLLEQVEEQDLPSHTFFGDGSPIPSEVVGTLLEAYAAEESAVLWQRGDVLLVDNLAAAHGRQPFAGPRQVAVSMAGALTWDQVDARRTEAA